MTPADTCMAIETSGPPNCDDHRTDLRRPVDVGSGPSRPEPMCQTLTTLMFAVSSSRHKNA
jgi:hypothetical protein